MECSYLICVAGVIQLLIVVGGITIENNSSAILFCTIAQGNYPSWYGPPTVKNVSTLYSNQQEPLFNPALGEDKLRRMTWADNKRDINFSAVIMTDEGNYTCTASDQGTLTVELNVRVPPALPTIYNTATGSQNELTVSGTEGTPLTLTCISVGGYPQQTVNWYRASVSSTPLQAGPPVIVSGDLYNVTMSYTFTPTSSDDGVNYICQSSYSREPQLIRYTEVKLFLKQKPADLYDQLNPDWAPTVKMGHIRTFMSPSPSKSRYNRSLNRSVRKQHTAAAMSLLELRCSTPELESEDVDVGVMKSGTSTQTDIDKNLLTAIESELQILQKENREMKAMLEEKKLDESFFRNDSAKV